MIPMNWTRRDALKLVGAARFTTLARAARDTGIPIQPGPFQAEDHSLDKYSCPDWFRDAKFGIWAHWGPHVGDWHGRLVRPQYVHRRAAASTSTISKTYGHPSKFGYKDAIPLWKAERFDPEALVRLYKQGGREVLRQHGRPLRQLRSVELAHHRWNSVNMGPKKDIVGQWREAARAEGLRFGVSEHVWGSYNWWETNKGADKQGPYAGVPYDGNDPANRDLYFPPHAPAREAWAEQGNEPEEWKREWFLRVEGPDRSASARPATTKTAASLSALGPQPGGALLQPEPALASREAGRRSTPANARSECAAGTCVLDVERGVVDEIEPRPSRPTPASATGITTAKRSTSRRRRSSICWWILSAATAICCSTSRCRPAACPTIAELKILAAITAWMKVNSEAIYATRPWKIFGEGPGIRKSAPGEGFNGTPEHFNESKRVDLTGEDIRFTTKGGTLYAFAMGWNRGETRIAALAPARGLEQRRIARVELLGSQEPLRWKLAGDGLHIESPGIWPTEHAVAFRILFS